MDQAILKGYSGMIIKAAVIAIAVILIYMQDLAIVFKDALVFSSANITNYILVLPFLVAYIIYRKRRMLIAHAIEHRRKAFRLDDAIGLTLVFSAMMLYIYGSLTLYAMEYHIYSIPIFVAGSTVLLFNLRVLRHSIFAIVILAYLQPPPAELLSEVAGDLSWLSATIAEAMLKAYGLQVSLQVDYGAPALVVSKDNTQTPFFVGEPSSGLFSTIGLSLFALIAAYIARGALWKRIVMYMIGFPIFFLLNATRISIILLLWYHYGEQVSETFHAMSGSIMAVPGTLAVLIIGERLLKVRINLVTATSTASPRSGSGIDSRDMMIRKNNNEEGCAHCPLSRSLNERICLVCSRILVSIPSIDGRAIARFFLIALIIAGMFAVNTSQVNAQSSHASKVAKFDMLSIDGRERDTVGLFLPYIDGYALEYAYRDQRVEKVLRQDAALAYRYIRLDEGSSTGNGSDLPAEVSRLLKPSVYVAVQISAGKHRWEDSMLIYPSRVGRPTAEVLELKDLQLDKDSTARFFAYIRPGQKNPEAVLYWYERVPLRFGDTYENRNVQIVLWSYTSTLARNGFIKDEQNLREVEEFYLSLAKPIKAYWRQVTEELTIQKTVEKTVRQSFPLIMSVAFLPASLLLIREFAKTNSSRGSIDVLYSRLADDDRLIVDAVISASMKRRRMMEWEKRDGANNNNNKKKKKDDVDTTTTTITAGIKPLAHMVHRIRDSGYATTEEVREEYTRLTGRSVSTEEIIEMLRNARDSGLVKSMIISVDDEPKVVWKSNVML